MTADRILPLLSLLIFAIGSNIALGYLRETSRKFSLRWFVLVHLSIPFIVILRGMLGFNWHWIPATLACAIAGQLIGGRIRRRTI